MKSDKAIITALNGILKIKLTAINHEAFGCSEQDALKATWTKIQAETDDDVRNNLVETLGKQLASGVEHGHVVCSTGKIARIIGTFDGSGLPGMETTRPLWAVKEEIATLAAKVRDDHVEKLPDHQKTAYEQGDAPRVEDAMRADFRAQAMKLYCDELKMSEKIIEPVIDTYEEAF